MADRLKAQRGGHRGVATKISKELSEILEKSDSAGSNITRLETLHESLTTRLEKILNLDRDILDLLETTEIETEINEASDVELRIKEILHRTFKFIQGANFPPVSSHVEICVPPPSSSSPLAHPSTFPLQETPQDASESTPSSQIQANSSQNTTKVKLPKLHLPKFKGDIVNFSSFWDIYESTIHTNKSLSSIDKYNYLKSYLEGEAARAIAGLPLTDANYEVAVTILKQRYGNKQQVISAHMDELLNIPTCGDKVHQLKFVYDKINVHVRGLEALGVDSEKYGSLLIPIIMARLPKEISLRVARRTSEEVWVINDILEIIRREVEAREMSENVKIKGAATNENLIKKSQSKFTPTASALHTDTRLNCVFCNSDHYSAACDQITDTAERRQILKREGRCFLCLRKNHRVSECKRSKNCRSCGKKHHQSICFPREKSSALNNQTAQQRSSSTEIQDVEVVTTNIARSRTSIILQTARAFVRGKENDITISARILFDSGSQRSYITKALRDRLNIPRGKCETLHLNTFGGNAHRRQQCDVVELLLRKNGEEISVNALTFPTICSKLPTSIEINRYPHLQSLQLADDFESQNGTIDILIGSDYYWDFVTGNVVKGDSGPVAVESKLGWILSGRAENYESNVDITNEESEVNLILQSEIGTNEIQDNLKNILSQFWQTESIGICNLDNENVADKTVSEQFLNEINHDGERYSVKLPWKQSMGVLPDHYNLSVTRTNYLFQRLKRNAGLLSKYDNMIQDQLRSGIIEKVHKEEKNNDINKRIHYMPHHGVVREDKTTTKLRIVYDGSASDNSNVSLNSCLKQGPNLIPSIFNILLRFRLHKIGLIADIEKAFLMIGIHPDDRDALRFLWFKNVEERNPEMVVYRFCRLVFGLRPSPSILGSTIQHHLSLYEHEQPEIVKELQDSLYVDDLTSGADTEKDAFNLYLSAKNIMAKGGFNLRKWSSNSMEVCSMITKNELKNNFELNIAESDKGDSCFTEEDMSYAKDVLNSFAASSEESVKILGVNWNIRSDTLMFEMDELLKFAESLPPTKRSVLKLSARIFDPLGLISAFTISTKVLFQRLCTDKQGWDEELSEKTKTTWESLIGQLQHLKNNVQVPRCYFESTNKKQIELHGFSDASGKAYAAMVYMRTIYNDHIDTALLCCKARVAPLKSQSIPRLELLGALILARLLNTVIEALSESVDIKRVVYWTDSTTVLCWIKNDRPWKRYVSNRVTEIRELTNVNSWRHISGNSNPADLPSRGVTAQQLVNSQLWWAGPEFLKQDDSEWPTPPCENLVDETALEEGPDTTYVLVNSQEEKLVPKIGNIMKCDTFSDITSLLRVTAYLLRFANNLKRKVNKSTVITDQLSADEIENARKHWIKSAQSDSFHKEIVAVRNKDLSTNLPYVKQFGLFMDEMGILRCKGRLDNSSLPYDTKNPIFLPGNHPLTLLIIKNIHSQVMHSGIRNTLTVLRENYWIPRGREVVKRLIRHCIVCAKYAGKTFPMQTPPNLPSGRVDEGPPWSNTGVDYAGPLYVHRILSKCEKTSEKVYVCLFTCASTRAVHLELVEGCSAEIFLRAFRRFSSRRGVPRQLFSDNAKNFKSACKEIERIRRSDEVQRYMANAGVSWTFIAEKAPWWGGFWERLVKSVKTCLRKSIGRASLSFDELHTLLIEVEGCLNARPLTYIYDDCEGVSSPLSPSHLIYGRKLTKTPNSEHFEIVSTNESLTKRIKYHRRLLAEFTKQWSKEYLTSLREHAKVVNTPLITPTVAVGDIVFLKDKGTAKCWWKLARVVELIQGKDNVVRAAKIRIMNNDPKRKPSILTRPIQLLIPTEVTSRQEEAVVKKVQLNPNAVPFVPRVRPQRQAAIVGEQQRRNQNMT